MVKIGQSPLSSHSFPDVHFLRRKGAEAWVDVVDIADLRQREVDPPIWKAHRIEFHLLMVVVGGSGRHMVDFEHHTVRRGCLIQIAPRQVHQFDRRGSFDAFLVLFVPARIAERTPQANWPVTATIPEHDFELIESLVRVMYQLEHGQASASAGRIQPKLLTAVLEIAQSAIRECEPSGMRPSDPELEAFKALVERGLTRHRELAWYARELGTSARTLTRRCKRLLGTGAKEYIDRRIALEAKRLLVHTDLTIETIGYRLGFSEATNFVKFFRRCADTTPAAFRKSYG